MKFRIKDMKGFEDAVFGAEDLLQFYPELLTGIELRLIDGVYFVIKNGKVVSDSSFFTLEEMQFMECCV